VSVDGTLTVDRSLCDACGLCAAACSQGALKPLGRQLSPSALLQELLRDERYFHEGGGVTVSGGEPLLQAKSLKDLLLLLRGRGIHTMVETAGGVPWNAFTEVLDLVDAWFFDLKGAGEALHRDLTGVGLKPILDNASSLVESGADVNFRMVVVSIQHLPF
jgi:pyruvate-formate lyase-activating enzyme